MQNLLFLASNNDEISGEDDGTRLDTFEMIRNTGLVVVILCCISDENIGNGSANASLFDEGKSMDETSRGAINNTFLDIFNIIMDFLGFAIAFVDSGVDMSNNSSDKVERYSIMALNTITTIFIFPLRGDWVVQQQQWYQLHPQLPCLQSPGGNQTICDGCSVRQDLQSNYNVCFQFLFYFLSFFVFLLFVLFLSSFCLFYMLFRDQRFKITICAILRVFLSLLLCLVLFSCLFILLF